MSELHYLASLYGVQTAYHDVLGCEQHASPETLLRVLRILGVPLERPDDAGAAIRQRRWQTWSEPLEPVVVAWSDEPATVPVRVRREHAGEAFAYQLELEDGEPIHWTGQLGDLPDVHGEDVEGVGFVVKRLPLPPGLPLGYHRLTLELGGSTTTTLVIAAPRQAPGYRPLQRGNAWGVFAPLYALHSQRSWGVGDFTDMAALMNWTAEQGGSLVGTLPLLASYWQETGDYSP
jgi:4-alpha-glucanotransferase